MMIEEVKKHLQDVILPFWKSLKDEENGGYYGMVDFNLHTDKNSDKGVILNSRILWFFSNSYLTLRSIEDLKYAEHAYNYLVGQCLDNEYGGVYWSVTDKGLPKDSTKHTYNQAFAIYALSSYYDASGDRNALETAYTLFNLIEEKCRDEVGYLEAFTRDFKPEKNDKLSENGVEAYRTMNTLLHVFEAYTELYRVDGDARVRECLENILELIYSKIYNRTKRRQEVFFDYNYNSLIDLHSYGHDIEAAWLIDRGLEVLGNSGMTERISEMTRELTEKIYETAYTGRCVLNENDRGKVDTDRIWWVQNEAVIGFINGYQKNPEMTKYLDAAKNIWEFCKKYMIDKRKNSEWFWQLDENNNPAAFREIAGQWKCPYHNGRMCFEIIRRNIDA